MFLGPCGDGGQDLFCGPAVGEIQILILKNFEHRTSVRVDKSREHKFSFEIYKLRCLARDVLHLRKITDADDRFSFYGSRVCPWKIRILRKNVTVVKNDVC